MRPNPSSRASSATAQVHGSYNNESADSWRRTFHLHVVGSRTVDFTLPAGITKPTLG
jgi:hypothetical protein